MTKSINFPTAMKQEKRWCAWFYEEINSNNIHERKKVPHNLNSPLARQKASSTNPQTWCDYQTLKRTMNFAEANPQRVKVKHYGGPGFFCGDGWAFLDLDNIPTMIANHSLGEHNQIDKIIRLLDHTYCEVSQSQSGLHFIFKVDNSVKQFSSHPKGGPEMYTNGRLIALTGNILDTDQPLKITTITQEQWEQLHQLIYGKYEPTNGQRAEYHNIELSHVGVEEPLSDQAFTVVDAIMKSNDARRFIYWLATDLPTVSTNVSGERVHDWDGSMIDYDPSSQDQACCNMLAYWVRQVTGEYDSQLIDEIFTHTHLFRPKWSRTDGGGTYGQRTIQQAINHKCQQLEHYKQRNNRVSQEGGN